MIADTAFVLFPGGRDSTVCEAFTALLLERTHTCYPGDCAHRHASGCGCGDCPACRLRAEGFARAFSGEVGTGSPQKMRSNNNNRA